MHPILFKIPTPWGELPIWSYGVMLGLSMIVAWYTIMHLGQKKEGLSQELMGNTFMVTAISALAFQQAKVHPDLIEKAQGYLAGKQFGEATGTDVAFADDVGWAKVPDVIGFASRVTLSR